MVTGERGHHVSSVAVLPVRSPEAGNTAADDGLAPPYARYQHIHPLTSLRFIAAAMIVLLHTKFAYSQLADWVGPINLGLGVPFFFVLSGFILTHAYPQLDEAGTRRFLVARFARLWPVHATMLVLTVLAMAVGLRVRLPYDTVPNGLANLTMVHAWVPYPDSYFSFNAPSWSISTEFGFYLAFPLLIQNWRRTWRPKLILAGVLWGGMYALCRLLDLPLSRAGAPGADVGGFINMNPLANLYLFVLGMASCLAWRRLAPRLQVGVLAGTVLEVAALALAGWCLYMPTDLQMLAATVELWVGTTVISWLPQDGYPVIVYPALGFAILIVVMALRRGLVSRALSLPAMVLLGEISYALYLVHYQLLLMHYQLLVMLGRVIPPLVGLPEPAVWVLYWLTCLVCAWVLWRWVERPARSFLRGWYSGRECPLSDGQWRAVGAVLAAAVLLVLVIDVVTLR